MIILFGSVGSGKSEQAKRLVAKLGCPHVSTSRLLRQDLTPSRHSKMLAGKLVDDDDIFSLLEPELKKVRAAKAEFILDGAPRSIPQVRWLDDKIKNGEIKFTAVIYLKVAHETVIKRLLSRGREDDQVEIIAQRLKVYDEVTTPVLDYLSGHGYKVNEIDGELPPDEVEKAIENVLWKRSG